MRVAFLGTPVAAVPALTRLAERHEIAGVFTQPDRPRGRSKRPLPSPVKVWASSAGLDLYQPARSTEIAGHLQVLAPIDVAVVAAYGMLIRPEALRLPQGGFINIHFSLLPRWRGAAPVQRAILAGDTRTGVTLMQLDEGLDTGPTLVTRSTEIGSEETAGSLTDRMAVIGSDLVTDHLEAIVAGRISPVPQPDTGATHAPKLTSADRRFDPTSGALALRRRIMAMAPAPGLTATLDGEGLKLLRAGAVRVGSSREPGTLEEHAGALWCATVDGLVELRIVQPAGRRPMSGQDWIRGRNRPLGRLA